ncbi:hypothetical protein HAX54_034679, partial [Datura stramonium]|nr:hypothetical protein [Datura stramonium]
QNQQGKNGTRPFNDPQDESYQGPTVRWFGCCIGLLKNAINHPESMSGLYDPSFDYIDRCF